MHLNAINLNSTKKSGVKQPHYVHYPLLPNIKTVSLFSIKVYLIMYFSLLLLKEGSFSQSGVPS